MIKASSGFGLQQWLRGFLEQFGQSKLRSNNKAQRIVSSLNPQFTGIGKTDTFFMSKEAFIEQDWVIDISLSRFRRGGECNFSIDSSLLRHTKYGCTDQQGYGFYTDYSPSGSYVCIGGEYQSWVFMSSEARSLFVEKRTAEIKEMMASGESLKSVTFREFKTFIGGGDYTYLCLEKREKDAITAKALNLCDKFENGELSYDNLILQINPLSQYRYGSDNIIEKRMEEVYHIFKERQKNERLEDI